MTARWSPDFLDLLTALNVADAKYMLVGGHAVGIFGRPRATKDFDLWIEASPDNAARVMQALGEFGVHRVAADALRKVDALLQKKANSEDVLRQRLFGRERPRESYVTY